MSRVDHPATAIRPPSEPPQPASATPRCAAAGAGGTWQAGQLGRATSAPSAARVLQRLAAVAEPQRGRVGEAMGAPGAQVAVDARAGLRPRTARGALAALAAAHGHQDRGSDRRRPPASPSTSPAAHPRLDHQPDDRFVAAVAEPLTGARLDQPAHRVIGQRLGDLALEPGGLSPSSGSSSISPSSAQPRREPAHPELPRPRRRGSAPPSSRSAVNPFISSRSKAGT